MQIKQFTTIFILWCTISHFKGISFGISIDNLKILTRKGLTKII